MLESVLDFEPFTSDHLKGRDSNTSCSYKLLGGKVELLPDFKN